MCAQRPRGDQSTLSALLPWWGFLLCTSRLERDIYSAPPSSLPGPEAGAAGPPASGSQQLYAPGPWGLFLTVGLLPGFPEGRGLACLLLAAGLPQAGPMGGEEGQGPRAGSPRVSLLPWGVSRASACAVWGEGAALRPVALGGALSWAVLAGGGQAASPASTVPMGPGAYPQHSWAQNQVSRLYRPGWSSPA